jgi:hypothetical protein
MGWVVKRQSGSHRTLSRAGWADFVFPGRLSCESATPAGRSTPRRTQPLREAFFPKPYPAQTLVEVTRLAMRDFLVEADVTAVVPA